MKRYNHQEDDKKQAMQIDLAFTQSDWKSVYWNWLMASFFNPVGNLFDVIY